MALIKAAESTMGQVLFKALDILRTGGIVAYPTETFYGLGVKYDREDSLERLYALKQRPREKAMPLIIGSRELLPVVADSISAAAESVMDRFWPGPLILILPAKKNLPRLITAGTQRVAVRIPGDSFALHLAGIAGFPITATSANPSGMPPAGDAETVIKYFNDDIDLIIDAGPTPGVLPSTIVDMTGDTINILREGMIKKESLLLQP
jgi:L-threonylcarbamoyladenylate synthase